MNQISKVNIQGTEHYLAGTGVIASCASESNVNKKIIVLESGCEVVNGILINIHFAHANTYGNLNPVTIYSSDQITYYSDPELTHVFSLAPENNRTILYSGTGNAYYYTTHITAYIDGYGELAVCDSRGNYFAGSLWKDDEDVLFMINTDKLIATSSTASNSSIVELETMEDYEALENKDPNIEYFIKHGSPTDMQLIDDENTNEETTWSSEKIDSLIGNCIKPTDGVFHLVGTGSVLVPSSTHPYASFIMTGVSVMIGTWVLYGHVSNGAVSVGNLLGEASRVTVSFVAGEGIYVTNPGGSHIAVTGLYCPHP